MNRSLLCAALIALTCSPVVGHCASHHDRAYRYSTEGIPDFSVYGTGVASYRDLTTDLGQPVQGTIMTDSHGRVAAATFAIPLEGRHSQSAHAAESNAVRSAVVASVAHRVFSSLLGSVEARIPGGVGSAVVNAVADQASSSGQVAAMAHPPGTYDYWRCDAVFAHGKFESASCMQAVQATNVVPWG